MSALTLYDLRAEYRALLELAADPDADPESFGLALDALKGELQTKAVNVAQVIKSLEGLADQIKDAERNMTERRKALSNKAERLREYLIDNMDAAGISKIESEWFRLTACNSAPSVEVCDIALIPTQYIRVKTVSAIDRDKILRALKDGVEIPGCRLKQGRHIKMK